MFSGYQMTQLLTRICSRNLHSSLSSLLMLKIICCEVRDPKVEFLSGSNLESWGWKTGFSHLARWAMLAEGSGHLPLFSCVCVIQTHMHATLDAVMFFSDEYVYIYMVLSGLWSPYFWILHISFVDSSCWLMKGWWWSQLYAQEKWAKPPSFPYFFVKYTCLSGDNRCSMKRSKYYPHVWSFVFYWLNPNVCWLSTCPYVPPITASSLFQISLSRLGRYIHFFQQTWGESMKSIRSF